MLDLKENNYQVRLILGPVKPDEVKRYFNFSAKEFNQAGLYIDVDYYRNGEIPIDTINELLSKAMELTSEKVDRIINAINILGS